MEKQAEIVLTVGEEVIIDGFVLGCRPDIQVVIENAPQVSARIVSATPRIAPGDIPVYDISVAFTGVSPGRSVACVLFTGIWQEDGLMKGGRLTYGYRYSPSITVTA
jgi:hypothetical protein